MEQELKEALRQIELLGSGIVIKPEPIEYIPSGFKTLNKVLGGGYPMGRIVEMYGNESGGKTTLALNAMAEAQKMGLNVCFIDAEHSYSKNYSATQGIDNKSLILLSPDSGEQVMDSIDILSKSGKMGLVVVDSVANLVPIAELEKPMDKESMGLQARMMSKGLRKITGIASKNKVTIIFINQLREKIGVMFANPEVTPGGKALKFYSSIRLSVRSTERLKDKDNAEYGFKMSVKIEKSKVGIAKQSCELIYLHGIGISKPHDTLYQMIEEGSVVKTGGWYEFKGKKYKGEKEILEVV